LYSYTQDDTDKILIAAANIMRNSIKKGFLPSVEGYSGCPVFDLAYETNGILTTTRGQTCCHGIMHGTLCDNTGGKIAMVTPSYFLKYIIDCC